MTGVEIDDRAGALAAFALAMKAAARLGRRRFFRMESKPDIRVLQNVSFTGAEMQDVAAMVGKDLFTDDLRETLGQFERAKHFGSLIVPKLRDPVATLRVVEARDLVSDLLLKEVQVRVIAVLRMAEGLSPKYHVVVANPPYMGSGSMDQKLKSWAQSRYATSKSDLFAMFMVRAENCAMQGGWNALVTMEAWMFLTSYSKLRSELLAKSTIQSLLHLPYEGRSPTAMGIAFGVVAFISKSGSRNSDCGVYSRLRYFELNRDGTPQDVATIRSNAMEKPQRAFKNIPGQTIALDASDRLIELFGLSRISDSYESGGICKTSNDELYLRRSWEISASCVGLENDWCLLSKGGEFRKYFGNVNTVMRWSADAKKAYASSGGLTRPEFWDKSGVTWTIVSSKGAYSFRFKDGGTQYNSVSPTIFGPDQKIALSYLNSKVASAALKVIAPTLATNVGEVLNLPFQNPPNEILRVNATTLITLARSDWDAYETSWDFTALPLLSPDHRGETLEASYATLRAQWQSMTDEMQRLEQENNRIFIDAYGLQDELTPEVLLEEITLTCNPAYRYRGKYTPEELEGKLRADTMREFLSYAVGCMFGRNSLDSPGLVLANQGDGIADYNAKVPAPSFEPDKDNVIPVLDGDWFADDITERFRKFLRVTFGEDRFQENLRFIEDALGKGLRKYFTKDFYADHVKRYKKRPIYWMFSSPKGSFNALIYIHRYRGDTVSVVLNGYLRNYITKLESHRAEHQKITDNPELKQGDRTRAQKEVDRAAKVILELRGWERDVILHLARQKIEIDLDDGVKANYPLFGTALKKIAGLN